MPVTNLFSWATGQSSPAPPKYNPPAWARATVEVETVQVRETDGGRRLRPGKQYPYYPVVERTVSEDNPLSSRPGTRDGSAAASVSGSRSSSSRSLLYPFSSSSSPSPSSLGSPGYFSSSGSSSPNSAGGGAAAAADKDVSVGNGRSGCGAREAASPGSGADDGASKEVKKRRDFPSKLPRPSAGTSDAPRSGDGDAGRRQ